MKSYDTKSIKILSGIDAIRQVPAMYIGSVEEDGAHQLAFEVIDNSIDEYLAGFAKKIDIIIEENGHCTIKDDGRGIPVGNYLETGVSACEIVLTELHSGGKFSKESYAQTTGLHGVGLSCVNALSEMLSVDIFRNGYHYVLQCQKGKILKPLVKKEKVSSHGTIISFFPDQSIFKNFTSFSYELISLRLKELAFLHSGIVFTISSISSGQNDSFEFSGGLKSFLEYILQKKKVFHTYPVLFNESFEFLDYDLAFQWTRSYGEYFSSFVNGIATIYGGEHLDGVRNGLFSALMNYASKVGLINDLDKKNISPFEIFEGLTLILSVKMDHPSFEGQTKTKLTNQEVKSIIEKDVYLKFYKILCNDSKLGSTLVRKFIDSFHARIAAKRASERVYAMQFPSKGINEEIYKKQFGERSKNWHDSAVWIANQDLLLKHVEHLKVGKEANVLDVCCGSGVVGASFKGKVNKITGLDLTPEMVNLAKARLDEVVQGNVYQIPFQNNSYDLVVTREVLHLLPQPEIPVSEIFRVLKPGGQFIVGQILPFGEEDASWMYRIFKKKQPLIFNMFQEEDFRNLLLGAGFINLEMSEYNLWESIDVWIDTIETSGVHRHEIRELFYNAPNEASKKHPFKILPNGEIQDLWRWCIFSVEKPK